MLYLGRKGWKSPQIFHVRMHSVLLRNTECVSAQIAVSPSSLLPAVSAGDGNCWRKQDNNYAPRQWGCHLFQTFPPPTFWRFHIFTFPSFKDRLSPCQSFVSCLEGCLSTAAPRGEAGRETDKLTDRQGLVSAVHGLVQKQKDGPMIHHVYQSCTGWDGFIDLLIYWADVDLLLNQRYWLIMSATSALLTVSYWADMYKKFHYYYFTLLILASHGDRHAETNAR